MPIDLVGSRLEERVLVLELAGMDVARADYPDTHAFLAPGVGVARGEQRLLGIGRVQAADVLVIETAAAAHENFPQWQVLLAHHRSPFDRTQAARPAARRCCLSAWANMASRTQAPCSCAARRSPMRWRLQGPLPFSTR